MTTKKRKYKFSRIPVRGLSLQQRLPLLICILLLCIILVFSISSYITVRRSYLQAGRERLSSLSMQLSSLFGQTFQNFLQTARQAANQEELRAYLITGKAGYREAAIRKLEALRTDSANISATLYDTHKRPVLHIVRDSLGEKMPGDPGLLETAVPDAGVIGKLHQQHNRIYFPVLHKVKEGRETVGYLLRWRKLSTTQEGVQQLSQLLGSGAILYVANLDGSVWSDLVSPVDAPRGLADRSTGVHDFENGKGPAIGAIRTIQHTPWMIMIEFTQASLLTAPNRFMNWLIVAGMLFTAIGSFLAWLLSRNLTRPLKDLTAASSALADGDYTAIVPVERRDEMGKLARAFNAMSGKIREAHADLEKQVQETGLMNDQLRELSAHLQNIREEERIHIAREMHDELGQLLTGFKMDVISVKRKMGQPVDPKILTRLDTMEATSDEAIKFVRKLSAELRPSLLDDLGLIAALEWHSQEFERRYSIRTIFQSEMQEIAIAPLIGTGVFRIFQESLTNIARHAGAHQIKATLKLSNSSLKLTITDDGEGFDPDGQRKTLGLLGMKERAIMIGGELDIYSSPGRGTTITVTIPSTQLTGSGR
ncbi:sensor histidine kinase [Terrimonas sp. NA20]|uniref:histidine kinase n=1 Tax=Terrimonas ginsenosidimutans TaxID=2908004 RepID=A0ABS9KTB2_9BACT|nr:sensor histidine kinase [Terrimonas ginsenosidimutans]MCG2615525.1 sensor histidine kinase [Terrimonas ginsenosidimutans]